MTAAHRRFVFILAISLGLATLASSQDTGQPGGKTAPLVLLADLQGAIGPATTRFVEQAIETAQDRGAEALVLRIDTPGGLVTSMRDMISALLGSSVPVIGYVAPPGAQAASAGTYIMYATHLAAMAPGTNMGAATPIQMGGLPGLPGDQDKKPADNKEGKNGEAEKPGAPQNAAESKAVNDAVAFIRSLAELRGRNVEWAEQAVREAASISADQALALKAIEIVAADIETLLREANGRTVRVANAQRTLSTLNARVEQVEPKFLTRVLSVLTNPNVAFILMLVGIYGLIFEFASPGTLGPGIIGVICLVLGLYSLNQLPIDYAGLILVIAGIIFMVAEAFTPSFGILGLGGLIAFVIGSAFLIDTDIPAFQISWPVVAGAAIASGFLLVIGVGYAWRSQRKLPASGMQHMAGSLAEVMDWDGSRGHVWLAGDRWSARGEGAFSKGDKVRVLRMDGLTAIVGPAQQTIS